MYSKRSPPTVSAGIELPYISIPSSWGIAPSTGISRRRKYSSMLGSTRGVDIHESELSSLGSGALAKTAQNDHAADAEASDRPQGQRLRDLRAGVQQVGKERRQGEQNAEDVEPRRRTRRRRLVAILQAELQQDSSQSDGSHHYDRQRTEELVAIGKEHDYGQRPTE